MEAFLIAFLLCFITYLLRVSSMLHAHTHQPLTIYTYSHTYSQDPN
jgi:hypothetical protein